MTLITSADAIYEALLAFWELNSRPRFFFYPRPQTSLYRYVDVSGVVGFYLIPESEDPVDFIDEQSHKVWRERFGPRDVRDQA